MQGGQKIPDVGIMILMRISEDAGIWRDVLAKSAIIDVIVKKPHKPSVR